MNLLLSKTVNFDGCSLAHSCSCGYSIHIIHFTYMQLGLALAFTWGKNGPHLIHYVLFCPFYPDIFIYNFRIPTHLKFALLIRRTPPFIIQVLREAMFHMTRGVSRSSRYMRRHPKASRIQLHEMSPVIRRAGTLAPRIGAVTVLHLMDCLPQLGDHKLTMLVYHAPEDDDGR